MCQAHRQGVPFSVFSSSVCRPRFQIRRSECDTATDIGYVREDGTYAAVRIADRSDAETIAGQLRVLAEQIARRPIDDGYSKSFNARRRRR